MHFQMPPYAHEKLVHVIEGAAVDVIIDLRKESSDYKRNMALLLFAGENQSVYIPKGFAHGFLALEDHTVMLYQTACGYHAESACGFARLEDFESPF